MYRTLKNNVGVPPNRHMPSGSGATLLVLSRIGIRLSGCGLATSPPHADCAACAALIIISMLYKGISAIKSKGYQSMPFNIQRAYVQYKQYTIQCISIYRKTSAYGSTDNQMGYVFTCLPSEIRKRFTKPLLPLHSVE